MVSIKLTFVCNIYSELSKSGKTETSHTFSGRSDMCNRYTDEEVRFIETENTDLKKKVDALEKRLRAYENPHMPSSKQIIKAKISEEPGEPKKKGAPIGHDGATRKRPEPDLVFHHDKPTCCPKCKSNKVLLSERKKVVEDVIIIPICYEINYYDGFCTECEKHFQTVSPDLPKEGNFGPNITALWSTLHYIGTIPFDRLSKISEKCFNIPISTPGLNEAIYTTSDIFEPNYNRIKSRVKASEYLGSDETRYSDYWLWDISTLKDVLVVMRKSRGSCVLKETLGSYYDGILNSDCFSAYEKYTAREYQKDWAHILRDAKDLAKHNDEGVILHNELSLMYKYIADAKDNHRENTPEINEWIRKQKQIILSWPGKKYESKAVKNLVLRLNKYLDHWFTCLKYDFVESTNNAREREIRKEVIARKVSGCHRSERGAHAREIMMSTILTAQKRGLDPVSFIRQGIEKFNLR